MVRLLSRVTALLVPLVTHAQAVPAELSDNTACAAIGMPTWASLAPFLQRLDLVSPYGGTSSDPLFMPLFSSHPLNSRNASVTTLAIFLHGLSAEANAYFCAGLAASTGRNALVIAPWHGNEQVSAEFWSSASTPPPEGASSWSAYWTTSRWLTGGNISPGVTSAARYTTSFDIMDGLIANITLSGLFPNLQLVSLLGFSAGSQFFSRHVWGSPVGGDPAASGDIHVRYILSDPGTYMYLDTKRPGPSCRPLHNTGAAAATCTTWGVPPEASNASLDCGSGYNEYKYGIAPGSFGSTNAYMAPYDTDDALRAAATERMGKKDIVFILGEEDTCNCNSKGFVNGDYCFPEKGSLQCTPDAEGGRGCCDTWPDATTSNAMDTSCSAMVQGSNRLQRGLLYVQHLNRVFPRRAAGPFISYTVSGMGHNNSGEYASAAFKTAAYADPPPPSSLPGATLRNVTLRVRSDGGGDYSSIQAALESLSPGTDVTLGHVTLLLLGSFRERVHVYSNFSHGVDLLGEGLTPMESLVIFNSSGGMASSWTCRVEANDVRIVNVAIANDGGHYNKTLVGQSLALDVRADRLSCWGCALLGGQDTLYTGDARAYFSRTYINGSCDSIFGTGSAVFDNLVSEITDTVTAHRGMDTLPPWAGTWGLPAAYLFLHSTISPKGGVSTFLGRPWGANATTVFLECEMDDGIVKQGWEDWGHGCSNHSTTWCDHVFYAEHASTGAAAASAKERVWWSIQLNTSEADLWTPAAVLGGWEPTMPAGGAGHAWSPHALRARGEH